MPVVAIPHVFQNVEHSFRNFLELQEVLALVTESADGSSSSLIAMSKDWAVLSEVPLHPASISPHRGVAVSWRADGTFRADIAPPTGLDSFHAVCFDCIRSIPGGERATPTVADQLSPSRILAPMRAAVGFGVRG